MQSCQKSIKENYEFDNTLFTFFSKNRKKYVCTVYCLPCRSHFSNKIRWLIAVGAYVPLKSIEFYQISKVSLSKNLFILTLTTFSQNVAYYFFI